MTGLRSRRWAGAGPATAEQARVLGARLGIPDTLATVLVGRGIVGEQDVHAFLRPRFEQLHEPRLLPGMQAAAQRVASALDGHETILVHGDFDADGMCAAALLAWGLERLGARVSAFVPHRTRDGYDFGAAGLERALAEGASLVVTADCGITAVDDVARAAAAGVDVVVTDHHRPTSVLPDAVALVNPLLDDGSYPFDGLAGVGVAFKLLVELFARRSIPSEELNQHLDLVAVGTIADRMPLLDENRVLVRAGLRVLARTRKPGLVALLDSCDIKPASEVPAEDVAFRLAPRLNSSGRVGEADAGLRLLLARNAEEARSRVNVLERLNSERVAADRSVTRDVEDRLSSGFQPERDGAAVVWSDGWHPGVVGIVASRVVEKWDRPAFVVAFDGDTGRGSARSVEDFNLVEVLRTCAPMLERFGGHRMAAGLTIRRANMEAFADRIRTIATERLRDRSPRADLPIDLEISLCQADDGLYETLDTLRPFGSGNPRPVLVVRGVGLEQTSTVGKSGAHLKARACDDDGSRLPVIGFGFGDWLDRVQSGRRYDLAFHLIGESWRGKRRLQGRLLDLAPTGQA